MKSLSVLCTKLHVTVIIYSIQRWCLSSLDIRCRHWHKVKRCLSVYQQCRSDLWSLDWCQLPFWSRYKNSVWDCLKKKHTNLDVKCCKDRIIDWPIIIIIIVTIWITYVLTGTYTLGWSRWLESFPRIFIIFRINLYNWSITLILFCVIQWLLLFCVFLYDWQNRKKKLCICNKKIKLRIISIS